MKIAIIGTGYVGLVSGTCFAELGTTVVCVDNNAEKIARLCKGEIPIYEPGLEELVKNNVGKNRLSFTTNLSEAIDGAEAVFIAVGTPPGDDGSADLAAVLAVAKAIGQNIKNYLVVVDKSTVPVGTAKKVHAVIAEEIAKRQIKIDFSVASNPEFLKEGSAIADFLKPDRVVIGVETAEAKKTMERLYHPFMLNGHPIFFMDVASAELTKYAANAMLATKISFINDIANLCEILGADIDMVRKGIGSDSRIGPQFIYAGAGYGGSCFPKDVKALITTAKKNNYNLELIKAVEGVNERQKFIVSNKIKKHFGDKLAGKKIAIWGLAFKPNTDDTRESPAFVVINELIQAGATVVVYDPEAMHETERVFGSKVTYGKSAYEITDGADALVLMTEWIEFRLLNYDILASKLKNKVIFDGRNIYDPVDVREHGFVYYGIGRK